MLPCQGNDGNSVNHFTAAMIRQATLPRILLVLQMRGQLDHSKGHLMYVHVNTQRFTLSNVIHSNVTLVSFICQVHFVVSIFDC